MKRSDELMRLNRVAFERNTQAFERVMAALDRHERLFDRHEQLFEEGREDRDDLKVFIREMNLKSEKLFQELFRRSDEAMVEQRRKTDAILAQLKDVREESRAQTQALIDRMPPSAQAA